MARICLWGTEEFTARLLEEGMPGGDLLLERAATFHQAVSQASEGSCAALVLEWRAGEQDLEPLHKLAAAASRPLLIVAPSESSEAVISLLETGVNDVVPAALTPREILTHLRSLLRRSAAGPPPPPPQLLEAGNLCLDLGRHEATVNGQLLPLPPREFALLTELLARAGQICPRQELIRRVWGESLPESSRTLDVHLGRLRARLRQAGAREAAIVTLPGVGYRLETGQ
jgi:two-component system response regulator RegX3